MMVAERGVNALVALFFIMVSSACGFHVLSRAVLTDVACSFLAAPDSRSPCRQFS
jgi:hypothetical protein